MKQYFSIRNMFNDIYIFIEFIFVSFCILHMDYLLLFAYTLFINMIKLKRNIYS